MTAKEYMIIYQIGNNEPETVVYSAPCAACAKRRFEMSCPDAYVISVLEI